MADRPNLISLKLGGSNSWTNLAGLLSRPRRGRLRGGVVRDRFVGAVIDGAVVGRFLHRCFSVAGVARLIALVE